MFKMQLLIFLSVILIFSLVIALVIYFPIIAMIVCLGVGAIFLLCALWSIIGTILEE